MNTKGWTSLPALGDAAPRQRLNICLGGPIPTSPSRTRKLLLCLAFLAAVYLQLKLISGAVVCSLKGSPRGRPGEEQFFPSFQCSISAKLGLSQREGLHDAGHQPLDGLEGHGQDPTWISYPTPNSTPRKLQINLQRKKTVLLSKFHSIEERTKTEKSDPDMTCRLFQRCSCTGCLVALALGTVSYFSHQSGTHLARVCMGNSSTPYPAPPTHPSAGGCFL